MNIQEVRKKKMELERKIMDLIQSFENETEAGISEIRLQQVTVLGSPQTFTSSLSIVITV